MEVIEFRPERDQCTFTFGGVAPVRKVQPGTMLRLWTDDAFCGNLRQPTDLPSAALTMPFVNPQTGPFHVAGANYSAVTKVPKALLPRAAAYGGMHRQLRETAAAITR